MTLKRWNPDRQPDPEDAGTTHTCGNCGAHVTADYVRVFEIDGEIGCCPNCEDRVRRNGKPETARSNRHSGGTEFQGVADD